MEEKFGISTKKLMVEEIKKGFSASGDLVITNCRGVASQKIERLRKDLKMSSSTYMVVKNSLVKRVLEELELSGLSEFIKDEVGIGFMGDVVEASKTLTAFSKNNNSFGICGGCIYGKITAAEKIKQLALLPPRNVLLAMALNGMKSPITGFIGVLKGLLRNLVYAISAIRDKRKNTEG